MKWWRRPLFAQGVIALAVILTFLNLESDRSGTRRLRAVVAVVASLLVSLAVFGLLQSGGGDVVFSHSFTHPNGNITHLHIDADITNGARPCDPIDETATVAASATHSVGVCIQDYVPNSIDNFDLRIRYTGGLNFAPDPQGAEEPANGGAGPDCTPGCLDDNPNANDGNDPAGFKLGGGWDCTVFGVVRPVGEDPTTPNVADARIACIASISSPDLDLAANPGLLATIGFQATGIGVDTIDFGLIDDANTNTVGTLVTIPNGGAANCGSFSPTDQVGCFGATIFKGITPTPTRTNTPTITPTPTDTPTPSITPTPTETPIVTPTFTPTPPPTELDVDGDGVINLEDNCPTVFNPDQTNTLIGPIDNGPGARGDDVTIPNEDNLGDMCDNDSDNDGLPDLAELVGCGYGPTDPGSPVLDKTYDDNGNGNPVPPIGTDMADDGPSWDTDGDTVLDGAECRLGSNPNDRSSRPGFWACGGTLDADGDHLTDAAETCGWGTNPNLVDTDGDLLSDCREAADVDGNGVVNLTGDTMAVARAAFVASPPTKSGVMDTDKNGAVNVDDVLFVVKVALQSGFCPGPQPPIPGDFDQDGIPDAEDNCARVFNPDFRNTPLGCIDNGPGLVGEDCTLANEDGEGDACDPDTDNDGMTDRLEALGDSSRHYACALWGGPNVPTDPGSPVLDSKWDEDQDGDPAPPLGSDVFDDGPSWDTDSDGVPDGAECSRGYDPTNSASRPGVAACGGAGDADGDGLRNAWETCGWGTNPNVVDSDGDTLGDCKEAADVDGNGVLNLTGDGLAYAKAALRPPSAFGKGGDFDIDKNGAVNLVDVIQNIKFIWEVEVCQ